MTVINDWTHADLVDELSHIQELASLILPRCEKFPSLGNIDYFAAIEPLKGSVSGDHLIILNFAEYNLPEKIAEAEAAGNPDLAAKLSTITDRFGILTTRHVPEDAGLHQDRRAAAHHHCGGPGVGHLL